MKRAPSYIWVLVGYGAVLALMSWLVLGGQLPQYILLILTIPAILSAYFFRRWLYLALHVLGAASALWISTQVSSAGVSWITIVVATLTSSVLAETLHAQVVARREAEAALRASEARLDQVIQSSPVPIFVLDAQHTITCWNPACERLTGVPADDVLGTRNAWRPFYDEARPVMADLILDQVDRDRIVRYYEENYQPSKLVPGAYTGEVYFPPDTRWHEEKWIRFSAAPLKDAQGQILGAIETLQDITEHRQTEVNMRRRNAQLEALRAISLDLTTELDLDTLLHSIIEHAMDFLDGNHGGLYFYRPERDLLERVISTGRHALPVGSTLSHGEGLSGLIWERGEPLYVNDYQQWEGAATDLEGTRVASVVGAPIQWGDEFLGVINVSHRGEQRRLFTEVDAELLSLFAGQAAIAIRNARLYEEAERRALEQKTLREASLALTMARGRDEVIEEILAQLQEVVPYDTASVQLLKGDHLVLVGGRGFPNLEELLGITFDLQRNNNPNREVIRRRGYFIVKDAPQIYENFNKAPHAQARIRSWLGVPLLVDEQLIGMIALDKQEPDFYTEAHARLAEAFAAQAAIVVKNTQLLEAAQQQSMRLRKALTLSELLHQGLAIDEVLQKIAQGTASLGFNRAVINVYDAEADVIRPKAIVGLDAAERQALEESIFRWTDVQSLFQERFRISHSFMIRQGNVDLEAVLAGGTVIRSEIEDRGSEYWRPDDTLLVPLWDSQGDPIGLLSVDEPLDGKIPDLDTIRTLETFANQAAIAVENAQLVEDLEAKVAARTAEIVAERDNSNAILQSVGHPIAIVDNERRIQYVNEAFVTLSGYLEEEVLNERIDRLIGARIFQDYLPALLLAETQGRGWQGELTVERKDGRKREVLASIVALHNAEGESVGYITSYQDVSRLNALDRARREFITNISHQLNTPLTTVGLLIDLLRKGSVTPEVNQKYLRMMRTEIDSLQHLVDDILTIARLDSGEALGAWRPISLSDILEHIETRYQAYADSQGIRLSVLAPPNRLPTVHGDAEQIIHLLSELIENALNFTSAEGQVVVQADVVQRDAHAWVTIKVKDTGPGLTPEELEQIFERFFRGRLAASGNVPGTGLGLSIAQALARAHGGQITVDSELGEGATFTIWLPES